MAISPEHLLGAASRITETVSEAEDLDERELVTRFFQVAKSWIELQQTVNFSTAEFGNMRLPDGAQDSQSLLDKLKGDEHRLTLIGDELQDLEGQLNIHIQDLYGLGPSQVKTIDEFLRRFSSK